MKTLVKHNATVCCLLTIVGAALLAVAFWTRASGPVYFTLFAVFSITFLGVRDVIRNLARDNEASLGMSEIAEQLGAFYQESAPFNVLGWPDDFQLTKRAGELEKTLKENLRADSLIGRFAMKAIPRARHVMTHPAGSINVVLFDFEYSDNEVPHRRATAAIESEHLDVRYFGLFPQRNWSGGHRLVVDGAEDARDYSAISEALDSNTTLEVANGFMLMYRNDNLSLQKCDVRGFSAEAFNMYTTVCDHLRVTDAHLQEVANN